MRIRTLDRVTSDCRTCTVCLYFKSRSIHVLASEAKNLILWVQYSTTVITKFHLPFVFFTCSSLCGGPVQRLGGGGRGCNKFVPVLGENGTKIAPPGDIFDQSPG